MVGRIPGVAARDGGKAATADAPNEIAAGALLAKAGPILPTRIQVRCACFQAAALYEGQIGFALFQAGSLLPRDREAKLTQTVAEMLKPLRPTESPPTSKRPMPPMP